MKQNKRIMQQLVEYSRPPSSQNKNMQQLDSQRQQSQDNSINLETNPNIESNETKFSVELQPAFNFEVCIEIGDGRTQTLFINENSDPYREAQKICKKYMLEDYIVDLLTDSLKQQIKKEKNLYKSMIESQALSKAKSIMGAQKIFNQSRTYRYNKHSQELWKDNEEQHCKGPVINEVSSEIVRKMGGKDKIIQSMARKFHEKQQQHILQQMQNQQREYEGYPFHPSIDPISRKVDETLHFSRNQKASMARYEHLYQQHKLIENKKQLSRRNSLMQIPFRPLINNVSRVIMQKKRSLGEFYPLSAGKQRPKSTHKYKHAEERVQKNEKKLRSKRQSLNSSSWQLCHHLYQEAKKRQQKIQKQTQKVYSNFNNWKIIENSNNLVFQLRQNRIGEVFDSLVKPPYHELHCFNIDQAKLNNVEKIFLPIFRQMRQINASLNREQFIEAGLRLLKYLSPNQRAILIRKNTQTTTTTDKQNQTRVLPINKKSKQIVDQKGYGQKSIYMRGLVYRSEIKNQIEKGREEKVRNELKSCTFKPKINSIPQNIGY